MPKKNAESILDALAKLPRNNRVDPFRRLNAEQKKEFDATVEYFKVTPDHPTIAKTAETLSERWGVTITEHWLEKKLKELNVKH